MAKHVIHISDAEAASDFFVPQDKLGMHFEFGQDWLA
jgi:hypothetical protein